MNDDILAKFGKRIMKLRQDRGFSQEDLASHAGLHRTYIGMIERAERNITLRNIEKLAQALGIELEKKIVNQNTKEVISS